MLEISWMVIMGLAAGMHCILMCGPLAMALPLGRKSRREQFWLRFLFIAGRVLVYSMMGLLVGGLGKPIYWLDYQYIILLAAVLLFTGWVILWRNDVFLPIRNYLQVQARNLLHFQPKTAFLSLGMANGFLPCGAVYAALAFAAVSGSATHGAFTMLIFGMANSWWHYILMVGWRIPPLLHPGFRFLASPRVSLAVVSIFLLFRLIQASDLSIPENSGNDRNPPKELHFCRK